MNLQNHTRITYLRYIKIKNKFCINTYTRLGINFKKKKKKLMILAPPELAYLRCEAGVVTRVSGSL